MLFHKKAIHAFLVLFILTASLPACAGGIVDKWNALDKKRKLIYTNIGGALAITGWGFEHWDYGKRSPHTESEGWFGKDTKTGGADKLGHVYFGYVAGRTLSHIYEQWDYPRKTAIYYGALSSFSLLSIMELGDSFSATYGFSYEDFIMNGVGSYAGYLLDTHPALAEKLDLRIEYDPTGGSTDPFTDYENSRYLMALKLEGFNQVQNEVLRFVEIHAGYYTRDFDVPQGAGERNFYIGVGFNFSRLLRRYDFNRTATFLQYYQLPGSDLRSNLK